MLLTDTDSLLYEIKTEDVYEDFYQDKNLFDFSDYSLNSRELYSQFFDPVNKNVIGKMNDEFKRKIISEFVGLKLRMYSLIDTDGEEVAKAKGMNKNIVEKIRHKKFKVNYIELELLMFVRFHCLVLMIKDIY